MKIRILLGLLLIAWCAWAADYESTGSGDWDDLIWSPTISGGPNLGHNGGLLGTDSVEIKLGHDVTFNPDDHFGGNDLAINGGQTLTLQGGSVTQTTSNRWWRVGQGNTGTIDIQDGTLNAGTADQLMLGIDGGTGSVFLGDNVGLADTAVLGMASQQLIVGHNSHGALTIDSDGLLTAADSIHFARQAGSTASFTMNGGRISQTSGDFYFGRRGDATGTLNDDARIDHTTGNWFWIAENAGTSSLTLNDYSIIDTNADRVMIGNSNNSDGTLTLNDSAKFVASNTVRVARRGGSVGLIDVNGGTLSLKNLVIGDESDVTDGDATGTVLIKAGAITVDDSLQLGRQGDGTLTISGGTLGVQQGFTIAHEADSAGELNISGTGHVTATQTLSVGRRSIGTLNQTEGTLTVLNELVIGHESGGDGTLTISAGTIDTTSNLNLAQNSGSTGALNVSGAADVNVGSAMNVGGKGVATVSQSGGNVTVSGELRIGQNADGDGTYDLTGGTLETEGNLHIARELNSEGALTISNAAILNVGSTTVRRAMSVGRLGLGLVTQTAGTVTVSGELRLGESAGGNGTYNISGGTLKVLRDLNLAHKLGSSGAMTISGAADVDVGTTSDSRNLVIGRQATGTLTQSSGHLTVTNQLRVGESGNGRYDISGGTLQVDHEVQIARETGSVGVMNVSDSAGVTVGTVGTPRDLVVGRRDLGTLNQTGGTVTVTDELRIGQDNGGDGTYELSAGKLDVGGQILLAVEDSSTGVLRISGTGDLNVVQNLRIGRKSTGAVEQSNGTVDVAGTTYLGTDVDGDGTFDLSGGTATLQGNVDLARTSTAKGTLLVSNGLFDAEAHLNVGSDGEGIVTQTGGTVDVGGQLRIGYAATGSGTYNLNGGTLLLNGTNDIVRTNGTFNFGGGTMELQSARDFSSPMTMTGIGGAGTIDTNGFDSEHSGDLTGAGTLNKAGGGALTISGNNAGLTGGYSVEEGNIVIANPGALGDPSRVHIAGGSSFDLPDAALTGGTTFGFAGTDLTVSGAGAFNVGDGGSGTFEWNNRTSLAPGNSPGELVINAATVNWDSSFPVVGSGGDYDWQLFDATGDVGDDWDMVTINGDLNIGASGNIVVEGLDALPNSAGIPNGLDLAVAGNTTGPLEILSAENILGVIGNISVDLGNLAPYVTYTLEENPSIHNAGHAALFITFTSTVPEPGTWALLGILLVAGVFYTRRSTPASK